MTSGAPSAAPAPTPGAPPVPDEAPATPKQKVMTAAAIAVMAVISLLGFTFRLDSRETVQPWSGLTVDCSAGVAGAAKPPAYAAVLTVRRRSETTGRGWLNRAAPSGANDTVWAAWCTAPVKLPPGARAESGWRIGALWAVGRVAEDTCALAVYHDGRSAALMGIVPTRAVLRKALEQCGDPSRAGPELPAVEAHLLPFFREWVLPHARLMDASGRKSAAEFLEREWKRLEGEKAPEASPGADEVKRMGGELRGL